MDNDYKERRQKAINYVLGSLNRLTNSQMQYFAWTLQAYLREDKVETSLGDSRTRGNYEGYIRRYINKTNSFLLTVFVGELSKRIEDNQLWKLYERENWMEAW